MDLITYSEGTMTKEDFESYKIYVQDVLNGYRPHKMKLSKEEKNELLAL